MHIQVKRKLIAAARGAYHALPFRLPGTAHIGRWLERNTRTGTIVAYPPVRAGDDFSDLYYRLVWYLHPALDQLAQIVIPYVGAVPQPGAIPAYLDPEIARLVAAVAAKVVFVPAEDADRLHAQIAAADLVCRWQQATTPESGPLAQALATTRVLPVDRHQDRSEGDRLAQAAYLLQQPQMAQIVRDSQEKFAELVAQCRAEKGYIYGTGPNLSHIQERDVSDGVSIACNSMVKNRALMERLKPPIITFADPIFHAGAARYAGEFRAYLAGAMDTFDSWLVVPLRHYPIYRANLDARYHHRLIALPGRDADTPNLDLTRAFQVTMTANIMTLHLIPLAATLFDTIYTAGFDGRPLEENAYFWKHDKATQITTQMDSIQQAHPAFFAIDYDDYYRTHVDIVARWLAAAEAQGKTVVNLTPSYVPALKQREGVAG